MAREIYKYCLRYKIAAISGNSEALRRFVKVKALEYGIDNANIEKCLDEETIEAVVDMLRK